jgi:hypothetical protein
MTPSASEYHRFSDPVDLHSYENDSVWHGHIGTNATLRQQLCGS